MSSAPADTPVDPPVTWWRGHPVGWVLLAGLLLSCFALKLPVPFTGSGSLPVRASDLVAGGVYVWLVVDLVRHVRALPRRYVQFLVGLLVFGLYCAVVTGIRYALGRPDASSLAIPQSIVQAIWVVALVLRYRPPLREVALALAGFFTVLSVISLATSLDANRIYSLWWQNPAIRMHALLATFATHVAAAIAWRTHRRIFRVLVATSAVHAASLVFNAVVVGSRIPVGLVAIVGLAVVWVLVRAVRRWSLAVPYAAAVLLALVSLYALQPVSLPVRYGIIRSPGLGTVMHHGPAWDATLRMVERDRRNANNGQDGVATYQGGVDPTLTAQASKSQSSSVRSSLWSQAWRSWRGNLVFGNGYRLGVVGYSESQKKLVTAPPHNFVLEVGSGYGIVGLLLWLGLFLLPLRGDWRGTMRDRLRRGIVALVIIGVGTIFIDAVTQPNLLNPIILMCAFGALALAGTALRRRPHGDAVDTDESVGQAGDAQPASSSRRGSSVSSGALTDRGATSSSAG